MPEAWFRMKVVQLWENGRAPFTIYLATVDWAISIPSFSNSPWMRGAPHSGLARLISRTSLLISAGSLGRPPRERDLHRQYSRKPSRCHRTTVAGLTIAMAVSTEGNSAYSHTKTSRSKVPTRVLDLTFRRSTFN